MVRVRVRVKVRVRVRVRVRHPKLDAMNSSRVRFEVRLGLD